jgi:endonuclease III
VPTNLAEVLDALEAYYGPQRVTWPTDPYEFLLWWHCGYPASDAACAKGWAALNLKLSIRPAALLDADSAKLTEALRAGGMVPELRAVRLKEIATRILEEFHGDLRAALQRAGLKARSMLKRFPGISDPGADRILLFSGLSPISAVPSNCPQVVVRIRKGREKPDYGTQYREAKEIIEAEVTPLQHELQRAYLLLKQHGQTLCKRSAPACTQCPVKSLCLGAQLL